MSAPGCTRSAPVRPVTGATIFVYCSCRLRVSTCAWSSPRRSRALRSPACSRASLSDLRDEAPLVADSFDRVHLSVEALQAGRVATSAASAWRSATSNGCGSIVKSSWPAVTSWPSSNPTAISSPATCERISTVDVGFDVADRVDVDGHWLFDCGGDRHRNGTSAGAAAPRPPAAPRPAPPPPLALPVAGSPLGAGAGALSTATAGTANGDESENHGGREPPESGPANIEAIGTNGRHEGSRDSQDYAVLDSTSAPEWDGLTRPC